MKTFAGTSMVLSCLGCLVSGCFDSEDRDCYCEGEELDLSIVGNLAGEWGDSDDGEVVVAFDRNHRIRNWHEYTFGCAPGNLPLVVGAETQRGAGFDTRNWILVEASTEPDMFDLIYFRNETVYDRWNFVLEGERLIFRKGLAEQAEVDLGEPAVYVRISSDPAPVPETPPCN